MEAVLNSEIVQYIFGVVVVAAGTTVGGAAAMWGVKKFAKQARDAWYYTRRYVPDAVEQVDEPTDPAIVQVAKWSPAVAKLVVAYAPSFLRALAKAIDEVVDATPPEREVNIGGATQ